MLGCSFLALAVVLCSWIQQPLRVPQSESRLNFY